MDYIYTKYPVNYNQLVDEILGATYTASFSASVGPTGLGLIMSQINNFDLSDGQISYSNDNSIINNLTITTYTTLTTDQKPILDYIVNNHIADPNYNGMDWSRRRDLLNPIFYANAGLSLQNFAGLSTRFKMIGCIYFFAPYSVRMSVISDSQDFTNWQYLLKATKQSREDCVEAMRLKVGQYLRTGALTLPQTQDFYKQVVYYLQLFVDSNAPDFKQWLFNIVGSPYENTGFAQTAYYSSQMANDLLDIYNGKY